MTKQEFFETIKDGVLENLRTDDPTLDGIISQVTKINNIVYNGLSFKSENAHVAPVIYLDQFFDKFSDEDLSIPDIIDRVTSIYREHVNASNEIDVGGLTDWSMIKKRVIPAICNAESCTEYLKDMPHESLCDLSVYYRILIEIAGDGEGSIVVNSYLMKSWGISYEQLKSQAWKNIHDINPPDFKTMFEVLSDMIPAYPDGAFPEEKDCTNTMHVLTNKSRVNGAVYMADRAVLMGIASGMNTDLIILPSSRHEVLILPYEMANGPDKWQDMQKMVSEINHGGTVSDEDFLADSVYVYRRQKGIVEKVA